MIRYLKVNIKEEVEGLLYGMAFGAWNISKQKETN